MSTRTHFEKEAKGNSDMGRANDEGLTHETSAMKLFTAADSHYELSWQNQIILLNPPPTRHHSFFGNLLPYGQLRLA